MAETLNRIIAMPENVSTGRKGRSSSRDYALLGIALIIDFIDLVPFNLPGSALAALFMMYLGSPPINSVAKGLMDLVPVLEWMPWCTLTVLHMRFGVSFGRLDRLLFPASPGIIVPSRPSPGTSASIKKESV